MRELIQPALKIMARTGLFLSVVAWVVGQWWETRFACPSQGSELRLVVVDRGWIFLKDIPISYRALGYPDPAHSLLRIFPADSAYTDFGELDDLFGYPIVRVLPGVRYLKRQLGFRCTIRHWFVISTLTAFNIILHFIYGKRPEGQPCES